MPLTATQRSALRKQLLQSGQATRGLDDDQLIEAAREMGATDIPGEGGDPLAGTARSSDDDTGTPSDEADDSYGGDADDRGEGDPDTDGDDGQGDPDGDESDADGDPAGLGEGDESDDDAAAEGDDDGDPAGESDDGGEEERKAREDAEREQRAADSDPMADMIRRIANEEIDGRDLDDRLSALADAIGRAQPDGVTEARVREIAAQAAAQSGGRPKTIKVRRPDRTTIEITGAHPRLENILRALSAGIHPLLVGPAGSGKSTLAEQAAEAMGVEFFSTGAVHQKYELTGYNDAKGEYVTTQLYDCATRGGVFLWDEIDASMPQPLVAFNQLLSNGKMYFPNGELVNLHPDAYFIAAANTVGTGGNRTYVGRNALDGATLNRYYQITVEYDLDLETRLAHDAYISVGGKPERSDRVDHWLTFVRDLRAKVDGFRWPVIISPRASINGAKLIAVGEPARDMREGLLYATLSDDQRRQLGV